MSEPCAFDMESFESVMSRRRQEIEVELMQLEVNAWLDINKEQQAAVSAEQRKLDLLTEEVHRARISYREKAAAFVKRIEMLSASAELRPRRVARRDALTQTETTTIDCTAGLRRDVEIARAEVEALKKIAELHEDQIRLSKEPVEGESFTRVRDNQRIEEEALGMINRRIDILEREVAEAEISADVMGFTTEDTSAWFSEVCPQTGAPWDEEIIEIEATGVQAGSTQSAPHPTGAKPVAKPGASQSVLQPTATPAAASQQIVLRPSGAPAGPSHAQPLLRPSGVQSATSQGVLRFAGVQYGTSQGALRFAGVQPGASQGMLRPGIQVRSGAAQAMLRPTGVQVGTFRGAFRPTAVQGATRGLVPGRVTHNPPAPGSILSQPAALLPRNETLEDVGLSWSASSASQGVAMEASSASSASSASRGRFIPKKRFLERFLSKN